ncbi:nicotinamide riboside kinase 1 isoform X2 [Myotis lucifugus]|uniref:nicotinamide riboside kinase 1 isoform X2 n=1 Tax=Myotis lucifugus TaxID=59463 RepID=UPI000CCC14FE|nr:nicotinamide riboside kinase 1 isoform X2 [Myotis lucifugus]
MLMKVGPNLKLLLSVWNILGKLSRRQRTTAPVYQALLPTTSPQGTSGHRKFQKTFSKLIMKTFVIGIGGQGLIRCYLGPGRFHSPDGCSLSVTLERSYHFFAVTPSFGYMECGTTSLGWCGQLKWTSHLSPKWKAIRGKETLQRESVTNGGKTTLAKKLQKHLPNCSVISQDDFFKPPSEIETDKNGFLQYDVLEALNMEKMMSTISCWMQSPRHSPVSTERNTEDVPVLIIEGFLLFNYNTRVYEPPDPPGYFDGHVWPMYLKHRQEIEDIEWEIVYLDGTKSKEDLFSQVYEDLRQELAKQKLSCKASLEGSSA